MQVAYESLYKLFYKDKSENRFNALQAELEKRLSADSTFKTGIITDSGELFLAVPRELSLLNERILRLERRVSAELRRLPPIAQGAMVRGLVINEVVSTNELEGVHSTRRQINDLLEDGLEQPTDTNKRFREFAKLYLELSNREKIYPSSPQDIRSIYDRIMRGEDMDGIKPDGRIFRKEAVDVWANSAKIVHSGVMPESRLIEMMSQMISLADSEDIPEIYSAIMAHFIFEYAHPFYDGNGRTGRYLLALYLGRPLSILTSLSLSRVIAENKTAYYKSFKDAEHPLNYGELTFFVMNILSNIQEAQTEILSDLDKKTTQLDDVEKRLDLFSKKYSISDARDINLLFQLVQHQLFSMFPAITLQEISNHVGLGKQMIRKHTKTLEEKGLIQAVTQRPLRFALSDEAIHEFGLL